MNDFRRFNLSILPRLPRPAARLGLLLALMTGPHALAAPVVTQQGQWQIEETTSAIDNTHSYAATLTSTDEVTNMIDHPEKATLGVVCNAKGLFLSLIWPDFLDNPYKSFRLRLTARTDDAKPETDSWIALDSALAKPGRDGLDWLNAHAKAHTLVVRVPVRHAGQEASFDVAGLDVITTKLNSMSCG